MHLADRIRIDEAFPDPPCVPPRRLTLMPDLRVGLIGFGLAGRAFHAPLIASTPGLRLDAVVTRSPERSADVRARYPGTQVVGAAGDLWDRGLDLVVVASPNETHVPLARAALEAGCAVVVDKPLAPTAAEAQTLLDDAERRGLALVPFHNRRWDDDFLTLRRLVASGALGDVWRLESRFERWRPQVGTGWRESAAPGVAGGLLYDLGAHLVDQSLVLLGPATHVYAELDARRDGAAVDDDAFVALRHASGARSHLWASAAAGQAGPRLRALGSESAFTSFGMDAQEAALRGTLPPVRPPARLGAGEAARDVALEPGDYGQFYGRLRDALIGRGTVPVHAADAVAALVVIEAAQRSAREGVVVRLRAGG